VFLSDENPFVGFLLAFIYRDVMSLGLLRVHQGIDYWALRVTRFFCAALGSTQ
jgi:hypothetical protein